MPRYEPLRHRLELRLEAVVLQLLLPLFFAISGLGTQIDSLNTPAHWGALAPQRIGHAGRLHHRAHIVDPQDAGPLGNRLAANGSRAPKAGLGAGLIEHIADKALA